MKCSEESAPASLRMDPRREHYTMKKEYVLSRADAILLCKDQFRLQNRRHRTLGLLIILCAVTYGIVAAVADPPQPSEGEVVSTKMRVIAALCVQIPIVSGFVFLLLKGIHILPLKVLEWRIRRQPDENFGTRVFAVSDDSVGLEQGPSTLTVKKSYIDEVVEGKSGVYLMHAGKAVFILPGSVFDPEELRKEILQPS